MEAKSERANRDWMKMGDVWTKTEACAEIRSRAE